MKTEHKNKHPIYRLLLTFGYLLVIGISVIYGSYLTMRYFTYSQTCFTTAQVQSDSRCLYILNGKVYNKGSRSKPHHSNPCGTDVTNIILSFHTQSPLKYLDPNYVGNICTNQPVATNTPQPPSPTPIQNAPTATPVITSSTTCAKHHLGDANCDGIIDITDYEMFRKEFTHTVSTVNADFDNDGVPTISDFETWRRGYVNNL